MSPAQDLRDYLVNTAGGIHTAASTFYGATTPTEPDEITALRDTAGFQPQDFMGDSSVVEFCGVLAIVRAASESAGATRAWAVYDALRRLETTISGRRYTVSAVSPPQHLGLDAEDITASGSDGRRLWSINFIAWRPR